MRDQGRLQLPMIGSQTYWLKETLTLLQENYAMQHIKIARCNISFLMKFVSAELLGGNKTDC